MSDAHRTGCGYPGPCTIAEKIRAVVSGDDEPLRDGFLLNLHKRPVMGPGSALAAFELDLLDWGALFGLGFALVREANPWANPGEIGEQAFAVAEPVWLSWSGPFASREIHTDVNAVVRCFDRARDVGDWPADHRSMPDSMRALEDALIALTNAAGA